MPRGDVLWEPSAKQRAAAPLATYADWVERERGLRFDDYTSLWRWSTEEVENFWSSIWQYYEVGSRDPAEILSARSMPGCRWFAGARLNYAEEMLRRAPRTGPALIAIAEGGERRELATSELAAQVHSLAAYLRESGIGPGDRVAAFLPNRPEAVVALLATASIGAIWTACAPDFGAQSVLDRFRFVEPSVLIATDGYRFGGREHDRREVVERLGAGLGSLRLTISVPGLRDEPMPGSVPWAETISTPAEPAFEQVPFDAPLWVLFSSGTTGAPKGIVHGHGGIVLEHLKSLELGSGVSAGDRFYFFSSTSWMVWNWLVGGLLVGATPILYDGSPGHPDLAANWRLAAATKANVFGTGAAYLTASEKAGLEPGRDFDLSALRSVIATGSPLPLSTWGWIYDHVGRSLRLDSSSGGTDICGGIVSGSPWLPVYRGELSAPCLGVRAEAFDESGEPVVGELGELVIREPMPSMPVGLWGDDDGERLRDAYFSRYAGVWRHGDWIEFTPRGSSVITGRSDATLNKAGVRMGSGDIYAIVDPLPGITDSLVLGIELPEAGYYMPLFVVPGPGAKMEELRAEIRDAIRGQLSPRHLPDEIVAVPAVPRTLTGKKLEIPIKRILQGQSAPQEIASGSITGAEALSWYAKFGRERVQPMLKQGALR